MTYALLGLIALVLLTGLVAFGVGHQRWSWGTLIAAILVLLTATGYLYLASRFAAYESKQVEAVGRKQIELAKVRDALMPDPSNGGRLRPIAGDGPESKSIAALTEEQERWRRVLDRIDTWRDRSWTKASFDPPKADGETGEIRIPFAAEAPRPAEGADVAAPATPAAAPDTPPLDPGATVYVFDDTAAQEGGHYLGAFRVQSSTVDAASGQSVLAILQTAARATIRSPCTSPCRRTAGLASPSPDRRRKPDRGFPTQDNSRSTRSRRCSTSATANEHPSTRRSRKKRRLRKMSGIRFGNASTMESNWQEGTGPS